MSQQDANPVDDNSMQQANHNGAVMKNTPSYPGESPRWGGTTKLVVALSIVAIFAFLLFRFLNLVGPLLLAFVLAYLFYPLADTIHKKIGISWRVSVSILYVLFLILLIGSITLGGLTVVEQIQNLIRFLTTAISGLPDFIDKALSQPVQIGPFSFDLSLIDVNNLTQQVLNSIQPILTRAGSSVVSVASGAATLIGWMFFILLISYFILAESGGLRLISFSIPGHADDLRRLGVQLNFIWNAFLRGQITIVVLTVILYTIILGALGLKFYFGLAIVAGLARFVPYVGPFIAWTTYGLVAYFQGATIFGIPPLAYVGLVVGIAWFSDVVLDNIVVPRLMSNALRVHPAAVMVSALVAFNLLGAVGVVLAAPVLATFKLILNYIFSKLFDHDPWEGMQTITPPTPIFPSIVKLKEKIIFFLGKLKDSRLVKSLNNRVKYYFRRS